MNKLIRIILTLAVGCTGSVVSFGQLQTTSGKDHKFKVKGDRVVLRDKSKPVRSALEEQYAKISEATRKKDLVALLALRTPDFTVKTAKGETWSYEQSADYVKRGFEQVQSIVSLSFTIGTISVSGNEAAAIIHQQWARMQMMKGKLRRVDTSAVQRETWINTPEGWRLKLIDDVHPGAWFVDGKRVDPSKPYDPETPPYEP
ncbi:MAG: nuclear transport factor 2 family protein [Pyrinomonadaceae bacterium]|nr:nuclear transport factor 2 family protein [Pyrinomonadaceae bacterium]